MRRSAAEPSRSLSSFPTSQPARISSPSAHKDKLTCLTTVDLIRRHPKEYSYEPTDERRYLVRRSDLSVCIRVHPWPKKVFSHGWTRMDTNNRASRPDCPSTAPATLRLQLTSRATATRDP